MEIGNSRGASTKTRIETDICDMARGLSWEIQEAHPLKQGLKQNIPERVR